VIAVIAYDIADDTRRERLATLLSGYGPRVQLSVFEAELRTKKEESDLRALIRQTIDTAEDQVRIYRLDTTAANQTLIIGAREVEERKDWCVVR
jgi:CRISPR-associated protein Cas2